MAAHSPLDADCSPGNELVQCVLSDVPLGLSKVAANYTLYASHSRDVVSSGVQPALDRAYFGSSADTIHQHLDVVVRHELKGTTGGPSLPEDRAAPVAVLPSPPAGLMVGGEESECVRRVSPDKRLEAQADKLLELCEILGWTRELHAAGIALKQLESVREMAKVTKRQRGRRRKRGCRVRESMSLPSHRCRIEGACKACGEERRPGVQVCLVELVDTGLPQVLLVSVTWKRVERCRCRLCRAEDENGSAWDGYKRRRRSRWIEGKCRCRSDF
jgi:hypothetical protein